MKGLFIVMEGPDGSGKTTQINLLKEYLEEAGYECLITREPGGTVIGEEIRQLILNPEHKEMSPVTEMLLYAASRAQLGTGYFIPCDRICTCMFHRLSGNCKKTWYFYSFGCKCAGNRHLSSRWNLFY